MTHSPPDPSALHHHRRRMTSRDRHESHRTATPLELLFDLTFVIAFGLGASQFAHAVAEGHWVSGLLGFIFAGFGICWAWINFSWFASAYDTDDWVFRLATMVQMLGVLVLAIGLPDVFTSIEKGGRIDNEVVVLGYVIMRVALVFQWLRAAKQDPARRRACLTYATVVALAQVGWVALMLAPLHVTPAIPIESLHDSEPETLALHEVELGKDYCLVISTSSGLWRYKPGDMVLFTDTAPYRVMVSGRTKHFINVFGEEVMVHNTDKALIFQTCKELNAEVADYTVAPVFMEKKEKGRHQWLIEFKRTPEDLPTFEKLLDHNLRCVNSDYDAKRHKDMALQQLSILSAPKDSFQMWLKSKGKLGPRHDQPDKLIVNPLFLSGQS